MTECNEPTFYFLELLHSDCIDHSYVSEAVQDAADPNEAIEKFARMTKYVYEASKQVEGQDEALVYFSNDKNDKILKYRMYWNVPMGAGGG